MRNGKKNRTYHQTGLIIFFLLLSGFPVVFGQDVSFSQYYANPLYLNPAFAGSAGVPRVALQYRDQWQQFDQAYTTYSAAIDLPVNFLQGGIGIHVLNDAQAGNMLNSFQINGSYSVYIRLNEAFKLHGALQSGYNQNSIDVNKLVFADNLDINYGHHGSTAEVITEPNHSFVDFSTGLLVYSKRLFFGGALHHLTEPKMSYSTGSDQQGKLDRKYTAHAGARLPVFRYGHLRRKFDVSPQLIAQKQGVSTQINYGMFAMKHGLTAGAWFRQNFGIRYDAMILLVGFVNKRMQFTYSYDWTLSGLSAASGGTSEISLTFLLKESRKNYELPFFSPYDDSFGVQ
ncbi:PorP/SprF family type IX secretion system membrane protein [Gaoshiqia sp. Z1-71]|uniref:PorP/SprF family type IX secretion system membrane protein n=1 Tax=Gaoshiqia hydrogeniformans TaxID=3290090 RepID=UPI003BF7C965